MRSGVTLPSVGSWAASGFSEQAQDRHIEYNQSNPDQAAHNEYQMNKLLQQKMLPRRPNRTPLNAPLNVNKTNYTPRKPEDPGAYDMILPNKSARILLERRRSGTAQHMTRSSSAAAATFANK